MRDLCYGTGRSRGWLSFAMFLLGLGSETKIFFYGCVALSELVVFAVAPFIFLLNWKEMRRDGFMVFIFWTVAITGGMLISARVNGTALPYVFKSFAAIYSVVSYFVTFYYLLKKNSLTGLGWFFFGFALSLVVTTFALNPTAEVSDSGFESVGQQDAEVLMAGPLYWIQRVKGFSQLPIIAAYLKTPLAYSLVMPILFTVFSMFVTISGRSASLVVLLGGIMILVGRKSRASMRSLGRHFLLFLILSASVVLVYKLVYQYAASTGALGNDAQIKYLAQTRSGGSGVFQLLMSGRKEFFIAIPAALDRPLLGFGPFPPDTEGYAKRFYLKYGDADDMNTFYYWQERAWAYGYVPRIPSHSYIMGAWLHYGIVGLSFYLWLLYLIYQHVKRHAAAIPQWYGYFAVFIPSYLWNIFFSPFGGRGLFALFIVCLLFSRSVARGMVPLPWWMEMEARKYD